MALGFRRPSSQRGMLAARQLSAGDIEKLTGAQGVDDLRFTRLQQEREARRLEYEAEQERRRDAKEAERLRTLWTTTTSSERTMTVSLYKTMASGAREIVVQTNAQSLDVFIAGLSDALARAIVQEPEEVESTLVGALKNAFPIAFAIQGYKAEKVSESKLLTCGYASPDASELVAQSKV